MQAGDGIGIPIHSCPEHGILSCRSSIPTILLEAMLMPDPREPMQEVQRMADRVCTLILSSDLPAIDIEIEKNKVRERCVELYPDREHLYEMIYASRFERLWDQFRGQDEGL
jgi:hypothetical protein